MSRFLQLTCVLFICAIGWPVSDVLGQNEAYDASWYDPAAAWVKVDVTTDAVFRLSGADLTAVGANLAQIDPSTLRLLRNGREIPIDVAAPGASLSTSDFLLFVGRRNTGSDEVWAYNFDATRMGSTFYSLYTDTTTYWLTWGGAPGLRYGEAAVPPTGTTVSTVRDTTRLEEDLIYFPGLGTSAGNPIYTDSEGFYFQSIKHNTSQNILTRNYTFEIDSPTSVPTDSLDVVVRLTAETVARHHVTLSLELNDGGGTDYIEVDSVDWTGLSSRLLTARIAQDALPSSSVINARLVSRNDFGSSTPNNILVDYLDGAYTRTLNARDGALVASVPSGGDFVLPVSGFSDDEVRVLSPSTVQATSTSVSLGSATVRMTTPGASLLWISGPAGWKTPTSIRMDAASDLANLQNSYDYVVITTSALMGPAQRLADYRSSPAGGGHRSLVININDIFDQFDYGRATPIAVRRFVRAARQWAGPLEFVTLLGDSLYPNRSRARAPWEVLSFGHTVSDGWFAMQNAGLTDYSESVAIGRVPIRTAELGDLFLQKLQAYEAAPLDNWQKRAMYLVGGFTDAERDRLQASALAWSATVSSDPTRMDTLHFFKSSSSVLDPTFKDSLQAAFREGASWATYFGHSATQTWEIVTDPPSEYENAARLPIILSLGCFTGDFALGTGESGDVLSFSEQLVIESLNGSIAHWGASASGTIGASSRISDEVHETVFVDTLRTLGSLLKVAKSRYNDKYTDFLSVKHLLQYGLIGEPATRVNMPAQPDLRMRASQIEISPFAPVPADREIDVTITLNNIGLVIPDSVDFVLTHIDASARTTVVTRRTPPFGNTWIESFVLPIDANSIGDNILRVELDPLNEYLEVDEFNNIAEQRVTVFSTGLSIANPMEFALVNVLTPKLKVNISAAQADATPVIFQLDTAPTFDSASLVEHQTMADRIGASWTPTGLTDETTYHWRSRIDDPNENSPWSTGSFTIRLSEPSTGWYQTGSLFESTDVSSFLNPYDSLWTLKQFTSSVQAWAERGGETSNGQFVVNGEIIERRGLGFGMIILDGNTGSLKASGSMPTYENDFEDPVSAANELASLVGLVEDGDYVYTRTRHLGNKNGETVIPDSIKAAFASLGSVAIDTLTYQDVWIMGAHIGFPQETVEFVDPPPGVSEITAAFFPEFNFPEGSVTSPLVGPARSWGSFSWMSEIPNAASEIRVDALSLAGDTLVNGDALGQIGSLTAIDARSHPFVRLTATLRDSSAQTTPQLVWWQVLFEEVQDLALDPAATKLISDSLLVGQPAELEVTVANLDEEAVDSVFVSYTVTNAENVSTVIAVDTLLQLTDTADLSRSIETTDLIGDNRLRIDVEQPGLRELFTSNNVVVLPFTVEGDATPPTFAVRFDGEVIPSDPEPIVNLQDPALPFVSSRPLIEVDVQDTNPYGSLAADTMSVSVTLDRVEVPQSKLEIVPSDDEESSGVLVRFRPDFTDVDSTHTVIVEVQDAAGNKAPDSPYQVHFRTQSAMQVESVYPYPNPMSTATTFAFLLRGADAVNVEQLRLRIYTVSGRLVREFDLVEDPSSLEAGALRIGWNKLRWDGRDDDGDTIATGVYLYKVFVHADGDELQLSNGSDVEKVVVIR